MRFFASVKFWRRTTLFSTFLLVVLVGLVFLTWQMYQSRRSWVSTGEKVMMNTSSKGPKLVLFYTPLWGRKPWPRIENDYQFNHWRNIPCTVTNCRISYDNKDLDISDAVLFHGYEIPRSLDLSKLSKTVKHRAKQRWIFFIQESPELFFNDYSKLKDVFNWTMTYKLDSDIFLPYHYYFPKTSKNLGNEDNNGSQYYSEGKDRLVAWMVSNCGKQRDKLVKKLMEYIPVHVYGRCGPKFSQNRICNKMEKNCLKTLRRYKFYLAFENANCVDYITEKYWFTPLQNNIVPVVLGGGNYSDRNLAVPGSFINVMDFKTVKDLADYLLMLDKNDTAYNEYFSWKKRYYLDEAPSWMCKMCAMLNDDSLPRKTYDHQHFQRFYGRETNCRLLDEKVDKIISD